MSEDGYKKLMAELKHLETVERPKISAAIAEARDKGDLSENAEYDAAKEAQGMLEMKINNLKLTIADAKIIDESKLKTDSVQILNKVELKNVKNGMKMVYTIVSESEANLKEGKISGCLTERELFTQREIMSYAVSYMKGSDTMNQEKIGRFIAENRKAKKLTQEGLAEKLGITNKSISKWENGSCLPDSSLFKPLCKILDISINELFAGEKLNDADKKEANECLINLLAGRLYDSDCGITYNEFLNALTGISETTVLLSKFNTKEEAVEYLMNETNLLYEECSKAYDSYISLNQKR